MTIDRVDQRILKRLEQEGRISNQDLADAVGLSPSACLRRVKLLEEEKIVTGYRCVIEPRSIGVEFEALVHVSMRPDSENWHERFIVAITAWSEVITAQVVTGPSNYVLTVRARNLDHYSDFVIKRLHRLPGVMSINSNIVLATLKRDSSTLDVATTPA